jgi:sugar phosphate isomerase/epimerase
MSKIPIALQLYSVRDDAAKDLASVLDTVAKAGYDGVEFAGYYGHDAPTLKKMLDDRGLKCSGAHVGLDTLIGDEFEKSVEFHKILDNPYLIVPGLAESRRNSAAALKVTVSIFNDVAARLKPHGQFTGYHNHAIEFVPMGDNGELMWDLFFGETSPDVIMQFDTGNALHGGADALPYLERYPGRAVTVHLKEYSATNDKALIGEGDVPFSRIFDVCESTGGTKWYIVEQESYAYPPLECAERCIKILRDWGK